jgi:4-amino-4-deoxy-L-arabinose transferase-like glycosyltransferase
MFVRLKPSAQIGILTVVVLIGAFFRLYEIDAVPPGAVYDPAYYGIDALEILDGARPIYLTTNLGREVLFSYLVALTYKFLGPGIAGVRATAAIIGALTIPAIYWLSREILTQEEDEVREYGSLLAALTMALSYWHLTWSRFGVRAILVPLFASLAFYYLWRGLRTQKRSAFMICGILLGASLYTYQVARLLPPLVLLGFAYVAISRRAFSRQDAINVVLTMGMAGLVFSPLAYYSWTHPGALNERISQVIVFQDSLTWKDQLQVIFTQLRTVLLTFSFDGQSDPLEAIPTRPLLNPFLSLAFYPGIFVALKRFKNPRYQFLLTWFGVMLVPALISEQGSIAKRAIGALPAVIIFISLGLTVAGQVLCRRLQFPSRYRRITPQLFIILVLLGFIYTAVATYHDYFIVWGQDQTLFKSQIEHAEIGYYIGGLDMEEAVYLSPQLDTHPVIRLNSGLRSDVRGYSGYHCMVYPVETDHNTTYVIVPGKNELSLASLEIHFPQGRIAKTATLPNDRPLYIAYQVPANTTLQLTPTFSKEANWSDLIKLNGYEMASASYSPGDTIHLTLYYQALSNIEKNYTAFVHLLGEANPASGNPLWGQNDREPCQGYYPTSRWQPGEIIANFVTLQISPDAPSGEYNLSTGFYTWPDIEQLPLTAPQPGEAAIALQDIQITDSTISE